MSPEDEKELRQAALNARDPLMYGEGCDAIFGLSLHPKYGGWMGFRGVLVLPEVREELERPAPCAFLADEDKRDALEEFNCRVHHGRWRDVPGMDPKDRYSGAAFLFFGETDPQRRRRFMEIECGIVP